MLTGSYTTTGKTDVGEAKGAPGPERKSKTMHRSAALKHTHEAEENERRKKATLKTPKQRDGRSPPLAGVGIVYEGLAASSSAVLAKL